MKCSYHLYWAENKQPIVPLVSIKHNWTKKNNLQIKDFHCPLEYFYCEFILEQFLLYSNNILYNRVIMFTSRTKIKSYECVNFP